MKPNAAQITVQVLDTYHNVALHTAIANLKSGDSICSKNPDNDSEIEVSLLEIKQDNSARVGIKSKVHIPSLPEFQSSYGTWLSKSSVGGYCKLGETIQVSEDGPAKDGMGRIILPGVKILVTNDKVYEEGL